MWYNYISKESNIECNIHLGKDPCCVNVSTTTNPSLYQRVWKTLNSFDLITHFYLLYRVTSLCWQLWYNHHITGNVSHLNKTWGSWGCHFLFSPSRSQGWDFVHQSTALHTVVEEKVVVGWIPLGHGLSETTWVNSVTLGAITCKHYNTRSNNV